MDNNLERLIKLIEALRGENGCPWDQKQTPKTMAVYLTEEVCELAEAIESGNPDEICEELGDVLFHIFFIARLFQEKGLFDIENVTSAITEKMIRRHPHIFGNATVNNADEVRRQWHEIKMKEKNDDARKASVLDSVPASLPALMRAYRISERAARTGFDWDDISGVMEKMEEEWAELKFELLDKKTGADDRDKDNLNSTALELGDVLFTLVNIGRFARIHPETALTGTIKKFETRFKYMEKILLESGTNINSASQDEMEMLWEQAKKLENSI
ncbi:MAG: nucleoside triphosphate pyrophosphohydrolase [Desulfobacterales bacterium]|nr:nucleoside triphosphate pyrophosphohydrolase [Desulfobacterales bacterium]